MKQSTETREQLNKRIYSKLVALNDKKFHKIERLLLQQIELGRTNLGDHQQAIANIVQDYYSKNLASLLKNPGGAKRKAKGQSRSAGPETRRSQREQLTA